MSCHARQSCFSDWKVWGKFCCRWSLPVSIVLIRSVKQWNCDVLVQASGGRGTWISRCARLTGSCWPVLPWLSSLACFCFMLMADGFIIRSEDDVKKYEYCFIKKVRWSFNGSPNFFMCWCCLDQLKTDEVAANEQSLIGFDGADSVLKVYLNGDFIGHSKGAR